MIQFSSRLNVNSASFVQGTVRARIIENLNKELELPFSISFVSTEGGGADKMRYGNPKAIVKGQKLKMMGNIWSGPNSLIYPITF